MTALDRFAAEFDADPPSDAPFMVDLGAGDGRDTVPALERGWRVLATDGNDDGLRRLRGRPECASAIEREDLEARLIDFESIEIPPARLINASFSLPFCPPGSFDRLWARIDAALPGGGRFAGQLFGDRHSWASIPDRTHLPRERALALFEGYVLEMLREEDRPSADPGAPGMHWHLFHIVARKR